MDLRRAKERSKEGQEHANPQLFDVTFEEGVGSLTLYNEFSGQNRFTGGPSNLRKRGPVWGLGGFILRAFGQS